MGSLRVAGRGAAVAHLSMWPVSIPVIPLYTVPRLPATLPHPRHPTSGSYHYQQPWNRHPLASLPCHPNLWLPMCDHPSQVPAGSRNMDREEDRGSASFPAQTQPMPASPCTQHGLDAWFHCRSCGEPTCVECVARHVDLQSLLSRVANKGSSHHQLLSAKRSMVESDVTTSIPAAPGHSSQAWQGSLGADMFVGQGTSIDGTSNHLPSGPCAIDGSAAANSSTAQSRGAAVVAAQAAGGKQPSLEPATGDKTRWSQSSDSCTGVEHLHVSGSTNCRKTECMGLVEHLCESGGTSSCKTERTDDMPTTIVVASASSILRPDAKEYVPAAVELLPNLTPARVTVAVDQSINTTPPGEIVPMSAVLVCDHSAGQPRSSFSVDCECLDVSVLTTGNLVVATKNTGLLEFSRDGRLLSTWHPFSRINSEQQGAGGDGACAGSRPRKLTNYSRDEQVRTVDVTLEGIVVVGLRRAKQIVILAPPLLASENLWTELGHIQLQFPPWRLAARGNSAVVTGMPQKRSRSPPPPVNVVSLLDGTANGDSSRLIMSLEVEYPVAGVALSDDVIVVSSWCDTKNCIQCFSRQTTVSLWRQAVDSVVVDLFLSYSGKLLYLLMGRQVFAISSESGTRLTRIFDFGAEPLRTPQCLHLSKVNGSNQLLAADDRWIAVYPVSGSV